MLYSKWVNQCTNREIYLAALTVPLHCMPFSIATNTIQKKNHHGLVGKNTSTRAWHTEQDFSSQHLLHKELRIWSLSAASCVVDLTLSNVWFHGNWADCKSSTSHKIAMLLPAEMCFSLDSMLIICPVETHRCAHLPATAHDHGTVLSSSQTLWCSYYV